MKRIFGIVAVGTLMAVGLFAAGAPIVASASSTSPFVALVSPANGPLSGGTFVTITGHGFDGATAVDFGTSPAPVGWYVKGPGTIKAIAPASATVGTVVVTVSGPGGTSTSTPNAKNVYNYVTGPTIQDVTPNIGPTTGGTSVTIAGQDFACPCGVTFGGVAATSVTADSATELTAVAPAVASPAIVPVVVTTSDGTTPTDPAAEYAYQDDAPIVDSVSPASGIAGAEVTITGSLFERTPKGVTSVFFGPNQATIIKVVNGKTITVYAPAGTGTVDVTVSDPKGTSAINEPGDEFTYTS
ncbi:MAG: IPT/TIG domain-containing protein [Acidimicrobiales bacterium]